MGALGRPGSYGGPGPPPRGAAGVAQRRGRDIRVARVLYALRATLSSPCRWSSHGRHRPRAPQRRTSGVRQNRSSSLSVIVAPVDRPKQSIDQRIGRQRAGLPYQGLTTRRRCRTPPDDDSSTGACPTAPSACEEAVAARRSPRLCLRPRRRRASQPLSRSVRTRASSGQRRPAARSTH